MQTSTCNVYILYVCKAEDIFIILLNRVMSFTKRILEAFFIAHININIEKLKISKSKLQAPSLMFAQTESGGSSHGLIIIL